jgi:branched-chain amino acid transport system permease protein
MLPPIASDAIVYSALTALMSVGLTLNYMTTKVPNFAQGTFITIGVYTSFVMFSFMKIDPYIASPLAFVIGGLAGLIVYLFALRPLAKIGLPHVLQTVATFAVSVIFIGIFGILVDYLTQRGIPNAAFFILTDTDFTVFETSGVVFSAPIILALVSLSLYLLMTRTKFGIGLRAAVENPTLAGTVGINVEFTRMFSWFLSGGLAALAGALIVLWIPGSAEIGTQFLLIVFAASVLGGLSSIFGTILGGIIVGGGAVLLTEFLSTVVGSWIAAYQPAIPLLIMSATLVVAPQGLISVHWKKIFLRLR